MPVSLPVPLLLLIEPAVVSDVPVPVEPVLVCGRRRLRRPRVPVVVPVVEPVIPLMLPVVPVVEPVVPPIVFDDEVVVCGWLIGVVVFELAVIEPIEAVLSTAPEALVPLVPLTDVVLLPDEVVKLVLPDP